MAPPNAALLVNVTGFIAGTVLYAMLFAMVLRPVAVKGGRETRRSIDGLLLVTAILGLTWNLEAFLSSGLREFGVPALAPIVQAAALSALGLLPAVVVHSVLRAGVSRRTSPAAWCSAWRRASVEVPHSPGGRASRVAAALARPVSRSSPGGLCSPSWLVIETRRQNSGRAGLWRPSACSRCRRCICSHGACTRPWMGSSSSATMRRFRSPSRCSTRLSLRARRPVPQAGADAARAGRLGPGRLCRHRRRCLPARAAAAPAARALGAWADGAALPARAHGVVWFVDRVVLARGDYDRVRDELAGRSRAATPPSAVSTRACAPLGAVARRAHPSLGRPSAQGDGQRLPLVDCPRAHRRRCAHATSGRAAVSRSTSARSPAAGGCSRATSR